MILSKAAAVPSLQLEKAKQATASQAQSSVHYGLELLHKLWNLTPGILFFKREMAEIAIFIKVIPRRTNINRKFLM